MTDRTITLDAAPANDNAPALTTRRVVRPTREHRPCAAPSGVCIGCEQFPAEGVDGLCLVCMTDLNEHIDARARYGVGDDEGELLSGGVSTDDGHRYL